MHSSLGLQQWPAKRSSLSRTVCETGGTLPGIDRDPGFNPVSRDPEPFYPDPDPSRFEFKNPDFSGFYRNFKIFNLHDSLQFTYCKTSIRHATNNSRIFKIAKKLVYELISAANTEQFVQTAVCLKAPRWGRPFMGKNINK